MLQNEFSPTFNDFHSHSSFQKPSKVDINDVDNLQMEVTELQTNDSLKNVIEPSDLRIFYCGLPSEIFPKIRKFTAVMMTVFASIYI
jgi:hypothetical protein